MLCSALVALLILGCEHMHEIAATGNTTSVPANSSESTLAPRITKSLVNKTESTINPTNNQGSTGRNRPTGAATTVTTPSTYPTNSKTTVKTTISSTNRPEIVVIDHGSRIKETFRTNCPVITRYFKFVITKKVIPPSDMLDGSEFFDVGLARGAYIQRRFFRGVITPIARGVFSDFNGFFRVANGTRYFGLPFVEKNDDCFIEKTNDVVNCTMASNAGHSRMINCFINNLDDGITIFSYNNFRFKISKDQVGFRYFNVYPGMLRGLKKGDDITSEMMWKLLEMNGIYKRSTDTRKKRAVGDDGITQGGGLHVVSSISEKLIDPDWVCSLNRSCADVIRLIGDYGRCADDTGYKRFIYCLSLKYNPGLDRRLKFWADLSVNMGSDDKLNLFGYTPLKHNENLVRTDTFINDLLQLRDDMEDTGQSDNKRYTTLGRLVRTYRESYTTSYYRRIIRETYVIAKNSTANINYIKAVMAQNPTNETVINEIERLNALQSRGLETQLGKLRIDITNNAGNLNRLQVTQVKTVKLIGKVVDTVDTVSKMVENNTKAATMLTKSKKEKCQCKMDWHDFSGHWASTESAMYNYMQFITILTGFVYFVVFCIFVIYIMKFRNEDQY